ncbi:MAG: response regulator [Pseudomonadota bacterium]
MANILIVDDDSAVADVIALVLEQADYTALTTSTIGEAKAHIERGDVAGALIDVWLQDEDGLSLAAHLAEKDPTFPFIIMSGGGPGRSLETVTARADSFGAHHVLYKPFDDDELLSAVEKIAKVKQI